MSLLMFLLFCLYEISWSYKSTNKLTIPFFFPKHLHKQRRCVFAVLRWLSLLLYFSKRFFFLWALCQALVVLYYRIFYVCNLMTVLCCVPFGARPIACPSYRVSLVFLLVVGAPRLGHFVTVPFVLCTAHRNRWDQVLGLYSFIFTCWSVLGCFSS